jgi:large subunit ribosomal protein L15
MVLNELKPPRGSVKKKRRVGRGDGSGRGKTCGRGSKGLKSRAGGTVRPGFEGGQMPLQRRLPKRGFTNIFKKTYAILNIMQLARFEAGQVVDEEALRKVRLVKGRIDGIKILGNGNLDVALTVKTNKISKIAREKIEAAGGKVEEI